MTIHSLIDYLAVDLSAVFLRKYRFFKDGISSAGMAEHLEAVTLQVPPVPAAGHVEVAAGTLAGPMNPAFRISQWLGGGYPMIIYHHGAGEDPFTKSFNYLFPVKKMPIRANLAVVRISFGRSFKEYRGALRTLDTFMGMLAVSTRIIELLVRLGRDRGCGFAVVTGISLGGFIANLHHAYFNSAQVYRPMLAGTGLGDLFLASAYRSLSSPLVLGNADEIRKKLNFDFAFSKVINTNVQPLLGRYDQIVVFERQKRCYHPGLVAVMDKGHTTGAMAVGRLRRHILEGLPPPAPPVR